MQEAARVNGLLLVVGKRVSAYPEVRNVRNVEKFVVVFLLPPF